MKPDKHNTDDLLSELNELRHQLLEANSIIEAIKDGSVDALVLNKNGQPQIYSIESADYTYRILIEKFGQGALSVSEDGLILYCNDYFAKLARITSNKIVGTYLHDYVEDRDDFGKILSAVSGGQSKGEINLNFRGHIVPVHLSLTDLNPTVHAIGIVVTDLSDTKKHEKALLSYQQRLESKINELHITNTNLEQFIHVISHDLKEPLRKILMYTTHLHESKSALFESRELKSLNIINSSAIRLDSLVDDLVKYAFSSTKTQLKKVDLNKVMSDVIDDMEFSINEKKAKIDYNTLPVISGAAVQLRQLFSNLISNAIKYGKESVDPQIKIEHEIVLGIDALDPEIAFHHISISDNGIGMEPKYIGKIFTIFQRLHARDQYTGNGIGLAISKKIMENHGGRIDAESEVGKGSTFHLYFPVR